MIKQKLIFVKNDYTYEANKLLTEGWRIANIIPAKTSPETHTVYYGAYVVLEKQKEEKINEEDIS